MANKSSGWYLRGLRGSWFGLMSDVGGTYEECGWGLWGIRVWLMMNVGGAYERNSVWLVKTIRTFFTVVFVLVKSKPVMTCTLITADSVLTNMLTASIVYSTLVLVWKYNIRISSWIIWEHNNKTHKRRALNSI